MVSIGDWIKKTFKKNEESNKEASSEYPKLNWWLISTLILLGVVGLLGIPYLPNNKSIVEVVTGFGTALIIVGLTELFLYRHHRKVMNSVKDVLDKANPRNIQNPSNLVTKNKLSYEDMEYAINSLSEYAASVNPQIIIGVNTGGSAIASIVANKINLKGKCFMLIARFNNSGSAFYQQNWPDPQPAPSRILVVNDALRSGQHMKLAVDYLMKRYEKVEIHTCAVLKVDAYVPSDHQPVTLDKFVYLTKMGNVALPWDPKQ